VSHAIANSTSTLPTNSRPIPTRHLLLAGALGIVVGVVPIPWLLVASAIVLGLMHPILALALMVLSVTAQDTIQIAGFSLTQIAVPVALLSYSFQFLTHPGRPVRLGRMAWAWACFLVILLLATVFSPYSATEGLKELWRWGAAALAWQIAATHLKKPWQLSVVVTALLLAPCVNAIIGLDQFLNGNGPAAFRSPQNQPMYEPMARSANQIHLQAT
jgi:hypothetical protein